MSYMKYALILTASSLMVGCVAAAPKLTASEVETKNQLSASQYQPAPRELRDNIETQQILAQAAFWSHEYNLNPSDLEAAIKFSTTLRKLGNPGRAVEVTRTTRALYPRDPYLNAEHAAALIANQQTRPAMKILDMALKDAPSYGRLWSLKGVALDQMEKYAEARPFYDRALRITPNDPNIMANLGLNYALSGDPYTAHQWLSRAAAHPEASESVYANLELVEGYMAQAAPQGAPRSTPHASRQPQSTPSYPQPRAPQAAQPHYNATSSYAPRQANPAAPSATPQAQYTQQASQYKPTAAPQTEDVVPTSQNVLARIARNVGPKAAAAPTYGQRQQSYDPRALPNYVAPYEGVPYKNSSSAQANDPNRVAAAPVEQLPQIRGGYPAPQTPYYNNAPQQQPVQRRGASRQR